MARGCQTCSTKVPPRNSHITKPESKVERGRGEEFHAWSRTGGKLSPNIEIRVCTRVTRITDFGSQTNVRSGSG